MDHSFPPPDLEKRQIEYQAIDPSTGRGVSLIAPWPEIEYADEGESEMRGQMMRRIVGSKVVDAYFGVRNRFVKKRA